MATFNIIQGDNSETLKQFPDNYFDSIVCDPPYGIDFLGKDWDSHTGTVETWTQCLRVLKPGGHILAFSAAKTYHRLATNLESVGFEIRDQIMWIYSSGFPKSQDVGRQLHKKANGKPDKQRFDPAIMIKLQGDKYSHPDTGKIYRALPDINGDRLAVAHEGVKYGTVYEEVIEVSNAWSGWGTNLKPAHEPIVMARKPLKQSIAKNVQQWGTGALNIDATRIPADEPLHGSGKKNSDGTYSRHLSKTAFGQGMLPTVDYDPNKGRFPSNVLGDIPDYQKYFYCPKVSRKERHVGFSGIKSLSEQLKSIGGYFCNEKGEPTNPSDHTPLAYIPDVGIVHSHSVIHHISEKVSNQGNNHPTVKPVALMRYLIQLVTPPGGHVLDPFCGSGSTGMAAVELGHQFTGCELDPNYVNIARTRIDAWNTPDLPEEFFE